MTQVLLDRPAEDALASHLLAIDDEPEILAIITPVAEGLGYKVLATTKPEEFKKFASEGKANVIAMDLHMPDCDGIELLRFLSEQHCRASIILISGVDERLLGIANSVGANLALDMAKPFQKPLRVSELRTKLRGLLPTRREIDGTTLRHALEVGQISLDYQPLIQVREGRLVGWEGLARWRHPELGLVPPDRFIPLAERKGLIDLLTDRVLRLAASQLAEWRNLDIRDTFISVNISVANLADSHLPDRLEQLCAAHGIPPKSLRLELTETGAMSDPKRFLEVLTRIRVKGFQLAIDDFGTGYSSLSNCTGCPFPS